MTTTKEELREKERAFRALIRDAAARRREHEKQIYISKWQEIVHDERALDAKIRK
jgi:hypothetical protein